MSTSLFERRVEPSGTLQRGGHGVEFYAYDAQVIATPKHRSELDGALAPGAST